MTLPSSLWTSPRKALRKTVVRQLYMKLFSKNVSCNLETLNTLINLPGESLLFSVFLK